MGKKYRAAVIGRTGRGDYGHGLDVVWKDVPDVEVVAVADDDKAGLAKAAQRIGVEQMFADYREMLDKVKPDVVSIGARWVDMHREIVVETAQRGVHIYLEKPLCPTLADADEMVAACERSHVKLALAHQTRYSPKIAVIKELIASGKLGRIVELRGRGKEDAQRGGGEDTWVLGSHIMDLIRTFGGEPEWCLAAVTQGGRAIQASDVIDGNEGLGPLAGDAVRAMYGLPGGVTAHFSSYRGAGGNPSRFGLEICGTAGVVRLATGYLPQARWLEDASWASAANGTAWKNITSAGVDVEEPLRDGGAHAGNLLAAKDLLAAIEEDRQPLNSVYDGRADVEMIVATFESQRRGGLVKFPLENRGNPLASLSG